MSRVLVDIKSEEIDAQFCGGGLKFVFLLYTVQCN
jgi:hypothetical protein